MTINCSEKIGEIGLDRLIDTYLCSKYGKDPTKCIDCPSLDGCPAGKRAIEILEDATGPVKSDIAKKANKGTMAMAAKARMKAEELTKVDDAIEYLVEHYGNTRAMAFQTIHRYEKKYPDLVFTYKTHRGIKINDCTEPSSEIEDEVALSDFLTQYDGDTDGDHICVQQSEDSVGKDSNFVTSLKAEYDRTQQRIVDVSTKIAQLEKEQEHLEKVLESMGDLMELMSESRKNDNSYNEKDGV